MTTLTNVHNIDEAIYQAVSNDPYERVGDVSVTGLIRPPQMAYLEHVHRDEIVEDVSDRLWALLGSAVHSVLERAKLPDALQEERLVAEVEGWTVSGKPDLWREPAILKDYKVTSVFSFLLGDKPDWEMQLNFYAALYRRQGFPVESLRIAAILRDHMKARAHEENYPPIPFVEAHVRCWPEAKVEEVLTQRVIMHQLARGGEYRPCTAEERWARPDVWAVKKSGNKRAMSGGLWDTKEVAEQFAEAQSFATEIEHRPGENVRCESYCSVADWCEQKGA